MPVRRLYRLMLHAYRGGYRRGLGRDMEETFVDRYRAVRRRGALFAARFTVRAFWDVIINAACRLNTSDCTPFTNVDAPQ